MDDDFDIDQPPTHRGPTKLERLMPHLPRIEKALRMGWRIPEIQKALSKDKSLNLGEISVNTFNTMIARARRRAAAQAAAPAVSAAPAVPAPVAPAAPPPSPTSANSVNEKMALLRADHARRAAAQAAELAAESGGAAPVAVAPAPEPAPAPVVAVAAPAPAPAVAAPVAPVVRAAPAPAPAPAQKPAAAAGTLTRGEKLAQLRALQLAAPEPTDPTLIAALRVRKGWLKPDDSIVAKAAVEGLQKIGAILCQPFEIGGASVPAKHFRETAAEYLKAVPQARLLIEESIVEHQAFWDADKPYVERTDAQIHENLVTAIKLGYADRLRAAEAKAAAGS